MKKKQKRISIPKTPNSKLYLVRNPDVSWTEISKEVALVNIQSGSFYTLNETGALIWSLADKKTLAEIGDELAVEYDICERDVRRDIWRLACKLVKEDLAAFSHKSRIKN
ncbi:PqqD family protein [Candidatus Omnitrophota bacterium]